ncbi:MAG: coenzyme F420-0:L-glutamate ligase [Deltaproteobacteria bacterium]|nr:coenzyme F420-0:L-glutamate ligase [Deltaproteobacteria bacterium]
MPTLTLHPLMGMPEIRPGEDLAALLWRALTAGGLGLVAGDVVVVAQKAVSKAEGERVPLAEVSPSPLARDWAVRWGRDPRLVELVLRESRRIIRMERGLIIAETHHGFVCANAGVDASNVGGEDVALLLPRHPDDSAARLRERLHAAAGLAPEAALGVIVADSFGRPWRVGLTQAALGCAGLAPLLDYRGKVDRDGRPLHATVIAVADQLAGAADLVCGKAEGIPAALIRGYAPPPAAHPEGQAQGGRALLRSPEEDLFR